MVHSVQEEHTYSHSGVRSAGNKHEMIFRFNSDSPQSGYKMEDHIQIYLMVYSQK
ncbi:hypothetical protein BH18THE2_BH18THE2_23630 [soil metagenome]